MGKLALGPIRWRGIVLSLWFPGLWVLQNGTSVAAAIVVAVSAACAARFAVTRVEIRGGDITVVNFFHTTRLPTSLVRSAGFAPSKWHGFPVPLVLVGEGSCVRANGISAYIRALQWPDQPFVGGNRGIARVQRFFEDSGIAFDAHQPVQRL